MFFVWSFGDGEETVVIFCFVLRGGSIQRDESSRKKKRKNCLGPRSRYGCFLVLGLVDVKSLTDFVPRAKASPDGVVFGMCAQPVVLRYEYAPQRSKLTVLLLLRKRYGLQRGSSAAGL